MTDETIDALVIARQEVERRLTAITAADWANPTPCAEWNVRQLVNHIVGHEHRFAGLLASNRLDDFVASRDDDFLGADPLASWHRGVSLLDDAIAGLDNLDTVINYRVPLPARDVLALRVFEAAVHSWDVSRAIGFDERLDERLPAFTLPVFERLNRVPAVRAFFANTTAALPSSATPQRRLLQLAGRTPGSELD